MPEDGYHRGTRRRSFEAVLYINGKREGRFTLGTDNEGDADRQIRELNAKRERDQLATVELTCDRIMGLYIEDRKREGKAAVFRMKECREILKPTFGALLPASITKKLCQDYIDQRRNINVRDSTIRTELTYLAVALNFAVDTNLIEKHPRIWRPPQPRPRSHVEDFHLTKPQAAKLLKAAEKTPHLKLFILLALGTAGRPLHILQLTWDRVDFHRNTVNLDDPERDRTNKGRARVAMNDELRTALIEARRHATSKFVIEFEGKPLKRIKGSLERAAARAGIKVSPYVLRHTAAVWMAEAGVPLEEIGQIMGHTNPAITYRVYARFQPGHQKKAVSHLQVRGSDGPVGPKRRNAKATRARKGKPA